MKKKLFNVIFIIVIIAIITVLYFVFLSNHNVSIEMVSQAEKGKLSIGDEISIGSEHFHIVSVNDKKVVLLAKYNLYVGDNFDVVQEGDWEYHYRETISKSNPLYGVQNSFARAGVLDDELFYGVVPFSAKDYWLDQKKNTLISRYGELETGSDWIHNNVYDSSYQDKPEVDYSKGYGETLENDYSIAYYIDPYLGRLKQIGAPNDTKIRLLLVDEIIKLGCSVENNTCLTDSTPDWVYYTTYWLGTVRNESRVWFVGSNGSFFRGHYERVGAVGVRPVIEIDKKYFSI